MYAITAVVTSGVYRREVDFFVEARDEIEATILAQIIVNPMDRGDIVVDVKVSEQ